MDIDINKMFKDKNKEIFKNSLTLEMERNLDTLKNTTDNCVALEINKLFLFFKKYFNEEKISYKKEELLGALYKERKEINDIVNEQIEIKKQKVENNFLLKQNNEDILSNEYIESYYSELKDETTVINAEIEKRIIEQITTKFTPSIIKKYKLSTIEQSERIHSRIDILFKDNIISRVKEQIIFRDESLKNMSFESFNKYLDLNKTTTIEKE